MAKRKLEVVIAGDASSLHRAFGQAGSSASSFGSKLARAGKVAGVAFAALGAVSAVGLKKSITAASDLSEQMNKTSVVFGKSAKDVQQWSSGLARNFGMSSRAALEATGTFGNMLVPMGFARDEAAKMSKRMVELAGDMASFNNASPEDTLEALRAGLAGESEPLRKFGVFLSDARLKQEALALGLYKGKGALDANAKAAATYSLILKDSKDAQGDFANTNDSLANAQRSMAASWENISASIGAKFLPVIAGAAAGISNFLDKLDKTEGAGAKLRLVLDTTRKLGADAWAALRAGFAAINWGSIWDSVKAKLAAVDWAATARAVGDSLVRAMASLSAAMQRVDWNKVGAAIGDGIKRGVAVLAQVNWGALIVEAMKLAGSVIAAILKVLASLAGSLLSGLKEVLGRAASAAAASAREIGSAIASGILAGVGGLGEMLKNKLTGMLSGALSAVKGAFGIKSPSTVFAAEVGSPIALGIALGVVQSGGKISDALRDALEKAMDRAKAVLEAKRGALSDTWSTLAGDATSAFDAIYGKLQTKSEKALAQLQLTQQKAQLAEGISTARTALTTAQAGTDGVVDEASVVAAQKQLDAALLAQQEFTLQQQAAKERLQLDARIALKRRHFEASLVALQTNLAREGASQDDAQRRIIALLNLRGVDYKKAGAALGNAFATGMGEALDAVTAAAQRLADAAAAKVSVKVSTGVDGKRAKGGPVNAGKTYLVGERGPELFTAARSGRIIPNGGTAAAGGGGTVVNVTVNGWVGSDQEIATRIQRELVRYGRRNTTIFSAPGVTV